MNACATGTDCQGSVPRHNAVILGPATLKGDVTHRSWLEATTQLEKPGETGHPFLR